MTARPWPQAQRALRDDPRWLGGDDAYSVVLSPSRRLWLFGDTFVAAKPGGDRTDAIFIHNSVAIAEGDDAETADWTFHWRTGPDGRPASFIPEPGDGAYHWPGGAALADGALVLFTMRVRDRADYPADEIETLCFFEVVGWDAFVVDDPSVPADRWELRPADRDDAPWAAMVGNAGVLVDGGWLYAHAWADRTAYVARWPVADAGRGDLSSRTQWWDGSGWGDAPVPTLTDAQTEFTVHREGDHFVLTEAVGLFDAVVRQRRAPAVQGPWSAPTVVYAVPPAPEAFSYAGKAHPGLARDALALTYNTIPTTLAAIRRRHDLYVPRFLRLTTDVRQEHAGSTPNP